MLRQSSNSMSDLSKSAQMPREREEESQRGHKAYCRLYRERKKKLPQRKTSSMLLSRNIVRGRTEDDVSSKKKQQPAKNTYRKRGNRRVRRFSSEDWSVRGRGYQRFCCYSGILFDQIPRKGKNAFRNKENSATDATRRRFYG